MAVTLTSVDGTWVNPGTYDAGELRRADAAMFASAGVVSGLAVSVNGSDQVTVTAGQAVISGEDAVTGTGVYRAGIPAAVTGSLEARDATNARIDLVVFRQYDTDVVGSHPRYKSEIEIIKGTPSATPAVPTRPSMATELARITVPASGGAAASVDSTHRVYAAAVGGGGYFDGSETAYVGSNPPAGTPKIRRCGTVVVTTASNGAIAYSLPSAFPNGLVSVQIQEDSANALGHIVLVQAVTGVGHLNGFAYTLAGAALGSTSVRFMYDAVGW